MKKVDVVEIHWRDATGEGAWKPRSEVLGQGLANVLTVGILIEETDDHYLVAACQDVDNDNVDNYLWVPKSGVVEFHKRRSRIGRS